DDVDEHEQTEHADRERERARDARADPPAPVLQRRNARLDGPGRNGEPAREREDDSRVAEREEEADADRALPSVETCAWCCRSPRCGLRRRHAEARTRTRGLRRRHAEARTRTRASRAPPAPGCRRRSTRTGPSPRHAA